MALTFSAVWMLPGISLRGRDQANWLAVRMILPAWLGRVVKSFSIYKEVQFKTFGLPVKTSYPAAENVTENIVLHVRLKCSPTSTAPLSTTLHLNTAICK